MGPRRRKGHGAPIIGPDDGIVVGNGTEVVPLFLDGGRIAQAELGDETVDDAEDADVSPEVGGGEIAEALDSEGGPAGTELYAEFFGLSGVVVVGGGGAFHFVGLDVGAVVDVGVGCQVEIGHGEFDDLAELFVFGPVEGGRLGVGIGREAAFGRFVFLGSGGEICVSWMSLFGAFGGHRGRDRDDHGNCQKARQKSADFGLGGGCGSSARMQAREGRLGQVDVFQLTFEFFGFSVECGGFVGDAEEVFVGWRCTFSLWIVAVASFHGFSDCSAVNVVVVQGPHFEAARHFGCSHSFLIYYYTLLIARMVLLMGISLDEQEVYGMLCRYSTYYTESDHIKNILMYQIKAIIGRKY